MAKELILSGLKYLQEPTSDMLFGNILYQLKQLHIIHQDAEYLLFLFSRHELC